MEEAEKKAIRAHPLFDECKRMWQSPQGQEMLRRSRDLQNSRGRKRDDANNNPI